MKTEGSIQYGYGRMAIKNSELMHVRCPQHVRKGR